MESEYFKNVTEKVVRKIAQENGFTNPHLEFCVATKSADNFVGVILRCVVEESERKLNLVVKQPPQNEHQHSIMNIDNFFNTEIFMYGTVLPTLADRYKNRNLLPKDALFPCTARTYAVLGEEHEKLIVMEDLKARGFVMKSVRAGLDEEHCRFILRQLARMHAASLALQKDDPKLHKSLTDRLPENLLVHAHEKVQKHFLFCLERFTVAINDVFPEGSPVRNKVEIFFKDYFNNIKTLVRENTTLCCITHGDLWINNLLFKYKEGSEDIIEDVCFLDLQISRFASPVTDIWYFLSLCTRKSTRKSYDDLIKCYHQSLCSFLRDLGHNPEDIVPWSLLQEELRKFGCFGWATAIFILPVILAEKTDMQLLEKRSSDKPLDLQLSDETKNRFIELVEDAEEYGLLSTFVDVFIKKPR